MKMNLPPRIEVNGPYYKFSSPYGKATLERDVWYVSRILTPKELKSATEFQKIFGTRSLGSIVRFRDNKRRYVINQLFPIVDKQSLQQAIDFLIENENKLVFCS